MIILLITGLMLNLAGVLVFYISLSRYLRSAEIMLKAHETYITSVNNPNTPIVQFTGAETHLVKGKKILKRGIIISILSFISGFALVTYVVVQII